MPRLTIAVALLLAVLGRGQSLFVRSERGAATIEINAAKTANYRIPRTVYGTFLEPIGRSIYGGLWAQLLENPSFEENLWSAEQVRAMIEREPALAAASRQGLPLCPGSRSRPPRAPATSRAGATPPTPPPAPCW
jgi:alpha-N-arabinofuranosidase